MVSGGSVAWGDYDNDGDLDILLTGSCFMGMNMYQKYIATMEITHLQNKHQFLLSGVRNSSAAWGDYDNDGDLDILLTGYDEVKSCFKNLSQ